MSNLVLNSFIPEVYLCSVILIQLVSNRMLVNLKKNNYPIIDKEVFSQTSFILVCLLLLFLNLKIEGFPSNFLLINDEGTRYVKILIVIACLLTLDIVFQSFIFDKINFFEFFSLFLLSLFSLLILVSSGDLLTFYLAIEIQSLCFYVLASIKRNSTISIESGIKYFLSGSFISAFFLFGCTLIYGSLGTLNLEQLCLILSTPLNFNSGIEDIVFIGVAFISSALLFKVACAPFHFWAPDVYDGSPMSSTITFSIAPKIGIIYFFMKWILSLGAFFIKLQPLLLFCGLFSAVVGTVFALEQTRVKRLIIYSSIAQVGFIICGLSLNTLNGFSAVFFFLIIYIMTSVLIWGHCTLLYVSQYNITKFKRNVLRTLYISDLTNIYSSNTLFYFTFGLTLFSVGGIPPLSGFFAKSFIFLSMLYTQIALIPAIILVIISAVSVYYYIRLIKIMGFEPGKLKTTQNDFHIVFYDESLGRIYFIMTFTLFSLIFIFFFPTQPLLFCDHLALGLLKL